MKRLSFMDSFSRPTSTASGAVKNLLGCITNSHSERARKRASVIDSASKAKLVLSPTTEHWPTTTTSTLPSAVGTSLCEYDIDTPSSWRCLGISEEFDDLSMEEKEPSSPLLDSQVFILWPEDFDFACAGEACHGRSNRRQKAQTTTRTPSSLRRWSSPHTLGFSTSVSPPPPKSSQAPRTTDVAQSRTHSRDSSDSVTTSPKKKPIHLRLELPSWDSLSGKRSKACCTSNKWGNQPPAGYI